MKDWHIIAFTFGLFVGAVVLDRYHERKNEERIKQMVEQIMNEK